MTALWETAYAVRWIIAALAVLTIVALVLDARWRPSDGSDQ